MTKRKIYKGTSVISDLYEKYNQSGQVALIGSNEPIISSIIDLIREDFSFSIKEESYFRIETKGEGHPWHVDTGTNNHMMWCQVGISIILKDGFTGGDTYYADDDKETNKVKVVREKHDICVHSSDQWHMVDPHQGTRTVLIMFI